MTSQPFTFAESLPCPTDAGILHVDGVFRHDAALIACYICDTCGTVLVIPNAPQIKATAARSAGDGTMRPVLLLIQSESSIIVPTGFAGLNGGKN